MLKLSLKTLSATTVLALATSGAFAQTPAPTTTIGVTPQEAKEATQKAVPRADTGTVVRTEPSAADRASEMAKEAKDAVTPDSRSTTTNAPMRSTTGNANPSEPRNSSTTTGTVNNTTTPNAAMGISGTMPGATATSGDATNMRNNPGTTANGNTTGSSMNNSTTMDNGTRTNRKSTNNRPARTDRN